MSRKKCKITELFINCILTGDSILKTKRLLGFSLTKCSFIIDEDLNVLLNYSGVAKSENI